MAQDYNIQLDNLNRLRTTVLTLIESLNNYKSAYRAAIDSSRENGLSVQMYDRLCSQNLPRTSAHVKALIESIEQIDIIWINNLTAGFGSAKDVAGIPDATSASCATSASADDKAERFRAATERIKERTAITAKKDADGEPQNEHDMHADYLAAFLSARKTKQSF